MKIWSFKVFVSLGGRDTFDEWIRSLDIEAQERIRAMIRRLSAMRNWERPHFASLRGHPGICEIIIKTKNKQCRPLGYRGPDPNTFTILIGASKKDNIWTPSNAIETAKKRRKLINEDRRYLGEYKP